MSVGQSRPKLQWFSAFAFFALLIRRSRISCASPLVSGVAGHRNFFRAADGREKEVGKKTGKFGEVVGFRAVDQQELESMLRYEATGYPH